MGQIGVVAKFVAKSGSEKALEKELANAVKPTQAEAGCILYELHRCISNPLEYWFIEQWESHETLDAHAQSTHIKTCRERSKPFLAAEPMVLVLDPVLG